MQQIFDRYSWHERARSSIEDSVECTLATAARATMIFASHGIELSPRCSTARGSSSGCRTGEATPIESTMEVVEFEPNRKMGMVIHDGSVQMRGWLRFEAVSDDRTTVTSGVELPGMDESMDKSIFTSRMEQIVRNIKRLIETEL